MKTSDIQEENVMFLSVKYNPSPSVEGRNYPPAEIIPLVDEVYVTNTKTGKETKEVVRYMPGEKSPFFSEQDENNKYDHKNKIKKFGEAFIIRDGKLLLNKRESHALDYLRVCNYNGANPKHVNINGRDLTITRVSSVSVLFKERDQAQEAGDFLKEDMENLELRNLVYTMSADELEAYAMTLGDTDAPNKKTDVIQRDLAILASSNPKMFREGLDDVTNKRKVPVLRAIKAGFVVYDEKTRKLIWEGGKEICVIPPGADPVDYFVSLTSTGKFADVLEGMRNLLKGEEAPVSKDNMVASPSQTPAEAELLTMKAELAALKAEKAERDTAPVAVETIEEPITPEPVVVVAPIPEPAAATPVRIFNMADGESLLIKSLKQGTVTQKGLWYSAYGFKSFAQGVNKAHMALVNNEKLRVALINRLN